MVLTSEGVPDGPQSTGRQVVDVRTRKELTRHLSMTYTTPHHLLRCLISGLLRWLPQVALLQLCLPTLHSLPTARVILIKPARACNATAQSFPKALQVSTDWGGLAPNTLSQSPPLPQQLLAGEILSTIHCGFLC